MTQEEKRLLLIDLCTRLPYGIKGLHRGRVHIITDMDGRSSYPSIKVDDYDAWFPIETFKPYLRPMSSMTEDEKLELVKMLHFWSIQDNEGNKIRYGIHLLDEIKGELFLTKFDYDVIDWLNSHHFDFRGLILMGLALEAPEGIYKTK